MQLQLIDLLRDNLSSNLEKYLAVHLIVLMVLSIISFKHFIKRIRLGWKTWAVLLLIMAFSMYLRISNSIVFQGSNEPEWEYKMIAMQMYNNEKLELGAHTYAFSSLLSLSFNLFGMDVSTVSLLNAIIGSLTVVLVFFLAYSLFKIESIALVSAVLFSALPRHVYYSGTGAVEPISLFFVILFLLLSWISVKINKLTNLLLVFVVFAYSVEIKIDNIILLPFLVYVAYSSYKKNNMPILKLVLPTIILIVLLLPVSYWFLNSENVFPNIDVGNSIENVGLRLYLFLKLLIEDSYYFIVGYLFLLLAFFNLKYFRQIAYVTSFLIIEVIFILVVFNLSPGRTILILYPGIVILTSLGIYSVAKIILRVISRFGISSVLFRKTVQLFIIMLLILAVAGTNPWFKRVLKGNAFNAKSDVAEMLKLKDGLPDEAAIICCGFARHCNFIMPKREVFEVSKDLDKIKEVIKKNKSVVYVKSSFEEMAGCNRGISAQFMGSYDLEKIKDEKFRYIDLFKVREKN